MELSIYEYRDYKRFLVELLVKTASWRHGGRIRFAKAIGCKPGYLTQVLNHDANLSLEQAERLSSFIGLNAGETSYFLLLVNFARAGSKSLKDLFRSQLDVISVSRVNMKDRAKPGEILSQIEQATYYSSWHYSVIHILCTIPDLASRDAMAERLGLSNERVGEILGYLESAGLVERTKGALNVTSKRVFVDKDSPFNYRHHANFRQLVMSKLDRLDKSDFHYSGVHSLSKDDAAKVVELIRVLVDKSRAVIKDSLEEDLFGFNIDFFRVGGLR